MNEIEKSKKIKEYFERNYFDWQRIHGRATLTKFAEFLGMSKGNLSNLMNGKRTDISMELSYQVCEKTRDYSLLEILGYASPYDIPAAYLPDEIRKIFSFTLQEIEDAIISRNLDPNSEDALALTLSILEKRGFKVNVASDL